MYGQEIQTTPPYGLEHRMTLRERLKGEKQAIEVRLVQLDEALELLDRNPDFEKAAGFNPMIPRHNHWCWKGKHFVYNCDCPNELPVNTACARCLHEEDKAKDQQVKDALEKIVDVDPGAPVI